MKTLIPASFNDRLRAAATALLTAAFITACQPPNPTGTLINPDTAFNLVSGKFIFQPLGSGASGQATWTDADGTTSGAAMNLTDCKVTLNKNSKYNIIMDEFMLKDNASRDGQDSVPATKSLLRIMTRNEFNFMVFASATSNLLASMKYLDSEVFLAAFQIGPQAASASAVGRSIQIETGDTAGTGTLTFKLIHRPNRTAYPKSVQSSVDDVPADLQGGILDVTIPIAITVQ